MRVGVEVSIAWAARAAAGLEALLVLLAGVVVEVIQ